MLFRTEYNVQSHVVVVIRQVAYRSPEGDVIVLDEGQEPPVGFDEFDQGQIVDL